MRHVQEHGQAGGLTLLPCALLLQVAQSGPAPLAFAGPALALTLSRPALALSLSRPAPLALLLGGAATGAHALLHAQQVPRQLS